MEIRPSVRCLEGLELPCRPSPYSNYTISDDFVSTLSKYSVIPAGCCSSLHSPTVTCTCGRPAGGLIFFKNFHRCIERIGKHRPDFPCHSFSHPPVISNFIYANCITAHSAVKYCVITSSTTIRKRNKFLQLVVGILFWRPTDGNNRFPIIFLAFWSHRVKHKNCCN